MHTAFPGRALPVGAGTLLLLTAACTAMRTVERAELNPSNPLTHVWVTGPDHTTVIFDSARVSGDSLIGLVNGQPQRFPLSDATGLRVREAAPDHTAGLVFFGVIVPATVVGVYLMEKGPSPPQDCQHFIDYRGISSCGESIP